MHSGLGTISLHRAVPWPHLETARKRCSLTEQLFENCLNGKTRNLPWITSKEEEVRKGSGIWNVTRGNVDKHRQLEPL